MTKKLLAFAAAFALVAPQQAQAQTFFGQDNNWGTSANPLAGTNSAAARADFMSYLVGTGTETFESVVGSKPFDLTFPGAGTATLNGSGSIAVGNYSGAGRRATSGSRIVEVSTGSSGNEFFITFSDPIAAFGVYATDVGDFGAQLTLQFYYQSVLVGSWMAPHGLGSAGGGSQQVANEGNLNFFGYINTSNVFNEIRFLSTGGGADVWGFDDMVIGSLQQVIDPENPGSTVPEPASMTLLATGLAGMAAARRRKQNKS